MPWNLAFEEDAIDDLAGLAARERAIVTDAIQTNLRHQPDVRTRNRKPLASFLPSFAFHPPLWQLRVGEFRVFYDLDGEDRSVRVLAIRRKPPHSTTKEIAG